MKVPEWELVLARLTEAAKGVVREPRLVAVWAQLKGQGRVKVMEPRSGHQKESMTELAWEEA